MAKHLIDTDVYIDFLQSGQFHAEIARIYATHTPGIYFSSVYTRNRADFELIQRFRHFTLVVLE